MGAVTVLANSPGGDTTTYVLSWVVWSGISHVNIVSDPHRPPCQRSAHGARLFGNSTRISAPSSRFAPGSNNAALSGSAAGRVMQVVLTGVAWRCGDRRNVAVLTGDLYDSVPAWSPGARAKWLGTCAFSGSWPVSDVRQLAFGTVVRARSRLCRHPGRTHFGAWPLYVLDEEELTAVHAHEPVTGQLASSAGVARPGSAHAAALPCVTSRAMTEKQRPATLEERLGATKTAVWEAWLRLWEFEEVHETLQARGTLPKSLTGVDEGVAVAAAAERVRVARARTDRLVEEFNGLKADVLAADLRARQHARATSRERHAAKVIGNQGPLAMAKQRGSLQRMWVSPAAAPAARASAPRPRPRPRPQPQPQPQQQPQQQPQPQQRFARSSSSSQSQAPVVSNAPGAAPHLAPGTRHPAPSDRGVGFWWRRGNTHLQHAQPAWSNPGTGARGAVTWLALTVKEHGTIAPVCDAVAADVGHASQFHGHAARVWRQRRT